MMYAAAGLAAVATTSTLVARQFVDYMPTKGVWEVNAINVDPNHVDDYLVGLKRTQVPGFEIMKKRGLIDDYKFLVRNGYTKDNPSVIIMTHYTSVAALEPDKARDEAIEKEIYASVSESQGKAAVAGYEKYRSFIDDAFYGEVTFPK
jgi:hypothetical protein